MNKKNNVFTDGKGLKGSRFKVLGSPCHSRDTVSGQCKIIKVSRCHFGGVLTDQGHVTIETVKRKLLKKVLKSVSETKCPKVQKL